MNNEEKNDRSGEVFKNMGMYEKRITLQERKIYDLKNLISMGLSLASNLNFESLVESILYSCMGQMFVDKVAILLQRDIDEFNFYIHMAQGYDEDFKDRGIILKEKSPLLLYLERNPETLHIDELKNIPEVADCCDNLNVLMPKRLVPMKSKDFLNGMIVLGHKLTGEEFSQSEKEFLNDLAKFAAIAVENSRLYLMATLDRMTRLYVHHYFQERLLEAMKRSKRNGSPMTLLMCDIDHFKVFNDTYGHQQGDIVLKEVAKLIKKSVRSIDIPARYGGEEFAIILPETEINSAIIVANRLRKEIELFDFPGQENPLHVTISIGVAQYNVSIDGERKDLIERADSALYKAKKKGRNRVVAHK